jgi:DNA-binding MarR family transcriptional regulator
MESSSARQNRQKVLMAIYSATNGNLTSEVAQQELARQIKLDVEVLNVALVYLRERGWARVEASYEDNVVKLTLEGLHEAEQLLMPWWKRWYLDPIIRTAVLTAAISTLLGLLGNAILLLLSR